MQGLFRAKNFSHICGSPFDNLGFCVPINENEVNFKLFGNIRTNISNGFFVTTWYALNLNDFTDENRIVKTLGN